MATCLVLGANGFMGSHLVDSLIREGHVVKAFDRFKNNSYNFLPNPKIEIQSGDFLNRHDLISALGNVDYVFHFISTTTPIESEDDPLIDIETNVKMSIELFQQCVKKRSIKKVIFASTGGSIYGNSSGNKFTEDTLPNPISPYAICKLTTEHYLNYFRTKYGLESVTFRISNPYGERQSPIARQGVIPIFLKHILNDEPITVLGDGAMVRDYIYVKDVVSMITSSFMKCSHNLYNIGSGSGSSINEIIDIINKIVAKPIKIKHKKNYSTFIGRSVLDVRRFHDEFQVHPKIDLETGIKYTWDYMKENQ